MQSNFKIMANSKYFISIFQSVNEYLRQARNSKDWQAILDYLDKDGIAYRTDEWTDLEILIYGLEKGIIQAN
jgi:hypothetical protein